MEKTEYITLAFFFMHAFGMVKLITCLKSLSLNGDSFNVGVFSAQISVNKIPVDKPHQVITTIIGDSYRG